MTPRSLLRSLVITLPVTVRSLLILRPAAAYRWITTLAPFLTGLVLLHWWSAPKLIITGLSQTVAVWVTVAAGGITLRVLRTALPRLLAPAAQTRTPPGKLSLLSLVLAVAVLLSGLLITRNYFGLPGFLAVLITLALIAALQLSRSRLGGRYPLGVALLESITLTAVGAVCTLPFAPVLTTLAILFCAAIAINTAALNLLWTLADNPSAPAESRYPASRGYAMLALLAPVIPALIAFQGIARIDYLLLVLCAPWITTASAALERRDTALARGYAAFNSVLFLGIITTVSVFL